MRLRFSACSREGGNTLEVPDVNPDQDRIRRTSLKECTVLALVAFLLCAPTEAGQQLLDVRQGTLTYVVVHKLHEVRGISKQVEGRALALPDGTVKVQVRAKVAT